MANGLMSDLKEFGQNFLLSAGTQLAENIREAGERDRKDILDATKELKGTIARNKAADAKITADLKSKLTTLRTALPGGNLAFYKTAMSSDANFKRVMKAADDDVNKTGSWFRDSASEFGISDPSSIYKALDEGGKKVKLSDIRTRTTTGPSKADLERDDSQDWKRTILGMRLDPNQVMTKVYKKIAMGGRNAIGPDDLQYAYGVPTRGITDSGLPLNIRKTQTALGTTQISAISDLSAPLSLDFADQKLVDGIADLAKQQEALQKGSPQDKEKARKLFAKQVARTNAIIENQQENVARVLDIIARNPVIQARDIINSSKNLDNRQKKIALQYIPMYQTNISKFNPAKKLESETAASTLGVPRRRSQILTSKIRNAPLMNLSRGG